MKKLTLMLVVLLSYSFSFAANAPLHPNDVLRQVPRGPGSVSNDVSSPNLAAPSQQKKKSKSKASTSSKKYKKKTKQKKSSKKSHQKNKYRKKSKH